MPLDDYIRLVVNRIRNRFESRLVAAYQNHFRRAIVGVLFGDGETDAARGAGDEDCFALKPAGRGNIGGVLEDSFWDYGAECSGGGGTTEWEVEHCPVHATLLEELTS